MASFGEPLFVLANLEDFWLSPEPQNRPGTTWKQKPNWQTKAAYPLEAFDSVPQLRDTLRALDQAVRRAADGLWVRESFQVACRDGVLGAMLSRLLSERANRRDHRESMFGRRPVRVKSKHAFAVVPTARRLGCQPRKHGTQLRAASVSHGHRPALSYDGGYETLH